MPPTRKNQKASSSSPTSSLDAAQLCSNAASRKDAVPRPISLCRAPRPTANAPASAIPPPLSTAPSSSTTSPDSAATTSSNSVASLSGISKSEILSAKENSKRKKALKRARTRVDAQAVSNAPYLKGIGLQRAREALKSQIRVATDAAELGHSVPAWIGLKDPDNEPAEKMPEIGVDASVLEGAEYTQEEVDKLPLLLPPISFIYVGDSVLHIQTKAASARAPSQPEFTSFPLEPSLAPVSAFVETVSTDSRRIIREPLHIPPDSPVKRLRLAAAAKDPPAPGPLSVDASDAPYTMSFWEEENEKDSAEPPRKRKRLSAADESMRKWLNDYRNTYLDALLWLDGRGTYLHTTQCTQCGSSPGQYRCVECHACGVLCKDCVVNSHSTAPFHWIQQWTGDFYKRVSLKSLGLRVQLGHPVGEVCASRLLGPSEFIVIHRNGIHDVHVDFCGCNTHGSHSFPLQLLHARLYPATTERPQTCATLDCLDDFHASSLHAKTSAYDYYAALEYLTDGSGNKPPNRYKAFMRMARQYRHLLLLKRGGRGHSLSGVNGTAPGELALRCPACPRPGINLPDNWQDASPADQCLYVMFIALDACFRLKRRLMGSDLRDPGLGTGWAFFVEWEQYRAYLKTITDQKEMSTCSGLAALDHANTKFSRGYAATGVGAGICARHEFVQPNGVGDLQRGERYGNMDYIVASLLRHIHERLRKVLSYDIACQWWKELKERLAKLPPLVRLHLILSLTRFVVPKMHIIAHIVLCRLIFDLRLVPGSGQTDGEGIERLWASIAGLAASSKLSGHGARADLLDDHWSFWNWCKLVGLACLLRRRLDNAREQLKKQEESFAAFCVRQAEQVPAWLKMVQEFEEDGTKPNPYAAAEAEGLTEKQVREQMDEEEREELSKGAIPIHSVSPSEFVAFGLELEEQQRNIQIQAALKRSKATVEKIKLKPLRRKLEKGVSRFRTLQATYTPSALVHLATLNVDAESMPENIRLLLPSALPEPIRGQDGCKPSVVKLEQRLRHAQCKDALVRLRSQLQIKQRLLIYKKRQSRHQGANTRSRNLIGRNESKIKRFTDRYRACRSSLLTLEGAESKEQELIDAGILVEEVVGREGVLGDGDEDAVDDGMDELPSRSKAGTGEGRRTISWIWTLAGTTGSDASIQDGLRIEWAKAYARVRRWREEVRVLEEEWRRLPISFEHERKKWILRREEAVSIGKSEEQVDGMRAYAAKQSAMYNDLILRAEQTRTEEWKGRGYRRRGKQTTSEKVVVDDGAGSFTDEVSAECLGGGDGPTVAFIDGDDESDLDYDDEEDSDEEDSEEDSDGIGVDSDGDDGDDDFFS
ncbi:CxC2 domain-containing protein [Mycena kentingensis (nom. inval.)]|nr:CxC2 domain-containing protein [Mycena kentingensis (nom. inval.)]